MIQVLPAAIFLNDTKVLDVTIKNCGAACHQDLSCTSCQLVSDLSRERSKAFVYIPSNKKLTPHLTPQTHTICRRKAGQDECLIRHTGNALKLSGTGRRHIPSEGTVLYPGTRGLPFFPDGRFCSTCLWLTKKTMFCYFPLATHMF